MDSDVLLKVALAGFVIGLAKVGFAGLGLLITPLLTSVTSPQFAVGVSLPMLIVGDFSGGWRFFGKWDKRQIAWLLPGCVLGVAIGTPLLQALAESKEHFSRAIGAVALCFAVLQMITNRRRPEGDAVPPAPGWVGLGAGCATAIVSTIAHQGGLVSNLYLLSQGLTKELFAATTMILYMAINLLKVPPYLYQGRITGETLHFSLLGMPFVVLGVLVGARLIERMNPKTFSAVILWLVVATAVKLLIWP
ncbi:MAG: sulfite exporter TauE/SafE family protein [Fimbriimonadaceae bacterium]|nr:sulfite exporter TauE/SafE family protein [Fimbriimonadaceae bacterium]